MPRSTSTRLLSALVLACTLSACDGGDAKPGAGAEPAAAKPPTSVAEPASKPAADPPPVATNPADRAPAPGSPQAKIQLAASVAREISATPELADEILGKHGLDRDKFDALIFEIAADPTLTKLYMAARRIR